jgi:hypothetical protein
MAPIGRLRWSACADRGVLGRPLHDPQRELGAVGGDAERADHGVVIESEAVE